MKRLIKPLALVMTLLMVVALSVSSVYATDGSDTTPTPTPNPNGTWNGYVNQDIDKSQLQTIYDITLLTKEIARDASDGTVTLNLYLAYQGNNNLKAAPISYLRIEPQIPEDPKNFPFKLEYSSYVQELDDLVEVKDADGDVTASYFKYSFTIKDDAVNGYYPITFKVYHLYANTNLQETKPAETTITTYVEIRHGKKPTETKDPSDPSTDPSTAILLLEGYTLNPTEITAGDEFDLTLKIRNTSDKSVSDVKSTLTEVNKTINPVNGASSFFIEKIGAGQTAEYTMRLKATATAGVQPVELTLSNDFVQDKTAKKSSDTFSIPVKQVANLSLDAPKYPIDVYQGDSFNLMMGMYNKGKSMLYNVSVHLESDFLKADENYYAGNMDSGSSKSYDVMVTPTEEASGQVDGEIVVTYEDAEGNVTEKRTPITLNVAAMDMGGYDDMAMVPMDEGNMMEVGGMGQPSSGFPMWAWFVIGGAVVAAVVIVVIVVARKRKKAKVEDDEMD